MKIVLFGYRNHPYTLDVLKEMNKNNILPIALIEPQHTYSMTDIADTPEIDVAYIKSVDFKNLINFWSLKLFLKNPISGIHLLKKVICIKQKCNASDTIKFPGIKLIKVKEHSDLTCEKALKHLSPDLIILCPASSIIRKNILDIPKYGVINAHMGKLPEYRGLSALEWTYLLLKEVYVSVHFVDEGVDTGDIISVNKIDELPYKISLGLLTNIARREMAKRLVVATRMIFEGQCPKIPQKVDDGKQYYLMHTDLIKKVNTELIRNQKDHQIKQEYL